MSDWFDTFTREARVRGVPDEVIHDVATEVRAETEVSGQDPARAFGDPALYARAVDETTPRPAPTDPGAGVPAAEVVLSLLGPLAGVIGWQLGSRSIRAWLDGTDIAVSGGDLVWWAILLVGTVAVVLWFKRVLRRTLLWSALGVAFVGLALLAALYLQDQVAMVPLVAGAVGSLVFLASSVVAWKHADRLQPPATDPLVRLAPWIFPILTALQGVMTVLLHVAA